MYHLNSFFLPSGISTTDIVGRILDHFQHVNKFSDEDAAKLLELFKNTPRPPKPVPCCLTQNKSNFLVTNTMMRLFSENPHSYLENAAASASATTTSAATTTTVTTATTTATGAVKETGRRVVYIAGSWDMFHAGHLQVAIYPRFPMLQSNSTRPSPVDDPPGCQCKFIPSLICFTIYFNPTISR